jgi:hypothetical protein
MHVSFTLPPAGVVPPAGGVGAEQLNGVHQPLKVKSFFRFFPKPQPGQYPGLLPLAKTAPHW